MASKISPASNNPFGNPLNLASFAEQLLFGARTLEPRVTVTHENGEQLELALSDAVADLYALTANEPEAIAKQLLRGEEMFAGRCVYQLKARA